jgi:hypothetical protein
MNENVRDIEARVYRGARVPGPRGPRVAGYGTSVRCGGRLELRRGSVHEHAFWSVREVDCPLRVSLELASDTSDEPKP